MSFGRRFHFPQNFPQVPARPSSARYTHTSCSLGSPQNLPHHQLDWRKQGHLPSPFSSLSRALRLLPGSESSPPRPHHSPALAAKEPTHRLPPFLGVPASENSPPESAVGRKRWNPDPSPQTRLNFPAAIIATAYRSVLVTCKRLP